GSATLCRASACLPSSFFSWSADPPDLHSFPTRRSSDLGVLSRARRVCRARSGGDVPPQLQQLSYVRARAPRRTRSEGRHRSARRSEEHTSELQSRRDLVCRLLLEKKKRRIDRHE